MSKKVKTMEMYTKNVKTLRNIWIFKIIVLYLQGRLEIRA